MTQIGSAVDALQHRSCNKSWEGNDCTFLPLSESVTGEMLCVLKKRIEA